MGIPIDCKRLAEVDFPIVAVSEASAKEKDIKTGSFASVHVWWARRPLAACRAMNFACMVPDPADENCPVELRLIIATALDNLDRFLKFKNQYPPKGLPLEIPAETGIMIDTELEFKIVEMMMKQKFIF